MVARGEHQRPSTAGASAPANTTTAPYDAANHSVLGNQLDPNAEPGAGFGYDVSHPGAADY